MKELSPEAQEFAQIMNELTEAKSTDSVYPHAKKLAELLYKSNPEVVNLEADGPIILPEDIFDGLTQKQKGSIVLAFVGAISQYAITGDY